MPTTPRFETSLPKRFFSPSTKPPVKPAKTAADWRTLAVVAIVAVTFGAAIHEFRQPRAQVTASAPAAEDFRVTPVPAPPVPEVRRAELPARTTTVATSPRAELLHIRGLNTWENDTMPDGRILATLYRGELPSARNLPTTGAHLGDMWYTRQDGHCWVLAPVVAGSQTVGWVDP